MSMELDVRRWRENAELLCHLLADIVEKLGVVGTGLS